MNYGLFLYADLATGERIEILKRNYVGAPRKIAAVSSWSWRPLDNDSAEVTDTPIVKGTLSLSIKDMRDFDYTAFFTVDATLWRVVLKYGGITRWSGYVQPESYSSNSEYRSDINIMALDNLGQLEHIEYNYFDSPFVSLRSLVSKACELVGWNFAPVVFDTQIISGDGVLIEDAVLNVETFRKKTWWEVLSDVLLSFGLQWAYFDNNEYRISSVANKFDPTRIVDIPDYTIEGGYTSDIVPPWKALVVKQDFQKFSENNVATPKESDFRKYKIYEVGIGVKTPVQSYIVTSGHIKSDRIPMLGADPLPVIIPQMVTGGHYYKILNKSLLIPIIREDESLGQNAYIEYDVVKNNDGFQVSISVKNNLFSVHQGGEQDYSLGAYPSRADYSWELNFSVELTPLNGSEKLYLYEDGFKKYNSQKTSKLTFKVDTEGLPARTKGGIELKDEKFNIISQEIPLDGTLRIYVYRVNVLTEGGGAGESPAYLAAAVINKISVIPSEGIPAKTETSIKITTSARTKKDIAVNYGEIPLESNAISYAGGVFKSDERKTPLHDWHRTDNLGGVLPLSEIVWRGYVHNFSRFQTNAGEPAGGKVLRGVFPFDGLKLNAILRFSTQNFTEYYAINSASISGREAELTLMQVSPYAHYTDFDIENYVDAGGGSFVGGGGDTYVTHMTGGGGADLNGKRLFALDEASEEEIDDLYLLADKPGSPEAKKIGAKVFARRKHAKQHFKGGADEIKPYDIEAARRAGDEKQDFAAQDLTARNATVAEDVKANNVFAKTKLISPFVSSPDFLAAMLGYGFGMYVDENGESHLHVDHGHFRGSIETTEARFRKMTFSGEDFLVSSGGIVAEILPFGQTYLSTTDGRRIVTQEGRGILVPSNGRVVFKLKGDAGIDLQQFDTGDILWYTWRNTETGINGASGFLLVKHNFNTFWYEAEVLAGSPERLRVGMAIGQRGNDKNTSRQGFIHISGRDKSIAIWDGVNSHVLSPSMLKAYLGDLRYVTDSDFPMMQGFGLYAMSCFLKGVFVLKSTGKTIETELSLMEGRFAVKIEDVESGLSSLSEQTEKGFTQTVSKTTYEAMDKRVVAAESTIKQTADALDLTVKKDGLIAQINLTPGQIKLEGTVTANDKFKILEDGSMEAVNGKFSGTIRSTDAEIAGKVTMNEGRVNGYVFLGYEQGDSEDVSHLNDQALMFYGANRKIFAGIGKNVVSSIAGYQVPARFENSVDNPFGTAPNIAMMLSASGSGYSTRSGYGNHALHISSGDISGLSYFLKKPDDSDNGMALDPNVGYYCFVNNGDISVALPNPFSTQVGSVFHLKMKGAGNVKIYGRIFSDRVLSEDWAFYQRGDLAIFVNDGDHWCFNRMHL